MEKGLTVKYFSKYSIVINKLLFVSDFVYTPSVNRATESQCYSHKYKRHK